MTQCRGIEAGDSSDRIYILIRSCPSWIGDITRLLPAPPGSGAPASLAKRGWRTNRGKSGQWVICISTPVRAIR